MMLGRVVPAQRAINHGSFLVQTTVSRRSGSTRPRVILAATGAHPSQQNAGTATNPFWRLRPPPPPPQPRLFTTRTTTTTTRNELSRSYFRGSASLNNNNRNSHPVLFPISRTEISTIRRRYSRSVAVASSTNKDSSSSSSGGGGDLDSTTPAAADTSSSSSKPPQQYCAITEQNRREVAADLFAQYSEERDGVLTLDVYNIQALLQGVGADPSMYQDLDQLQHMLKVTDWNGDGYICLEEFVDQAHLFLNGNPARIILVVGGPGSGKGVLCQRLQDECHAVHLSSGELLRAEVARQTPLGQQVQEIMKEGKLVSSAIMVALMKQHMRNHPGKRVLLDGFPRSLENAHDLTTLCGKPELALHLVCDDTVLLERILGRNSELDKQDRRADDNFHTALERLRTFHKYHPQTMEWLREQHVPIVNLDCSGSAESVWQQLQAIGRLMRPAVQMLPPASLPPQQQQPPPQR